MLFLGNDRQSGRGLNPLLVVPLASLRGTAAGAPLASPPTVFATGRVRRLPGLPWTVGTLVLARRATPSRNGPLRAWMKRCTKGKGLAAFGLLASFTGVVCRQVARVVSIGALSEVTQLHGWLRPLVASAIPVVIRRPSAFAGDGVEPAATQGVESGFGRRRRWVPDLRVSGCSRQRAAARLALRRRAGRGLRPQCDAHTPKRWVARVAVRCWLRPTPGCLAPDRKCHHRESDWPSCCAPAWVFGFRQGQPLAHAGARRLPHAAAKGRSRASGCERLGPRSGRLRSSS